MTEDTVRKRLEHERKAFRVHRWIYLTVVTILATINLAVVPHYLWFVYPLLGWGFGVTMHYVFGVRRLERIVGCTCDAVLSTHNEPVRRQS